MTKQEKGQIELLRTSGYSYGEIAKMLTLTRSTVSNYCLRNDISAPDKDIAQALSYGYRLCPNCKRLFEVQNQKSKQFCSDICRVKYWQREEKEQQATLMESQNHETLLKELDFLAVKSDEWDGSEELILCCRKEPTIVEEEE